MTKLEQLRIVALTEGVSFLVLLFIAMPLKYMAGIPLAVRIAGMLHGVFFVLFILALFGAASDREWPLRRSIMAFVSSIFPFGTFIFDKSLRSEIEDAREGIKGCFTLPKAE